MREHYGNRISSSQLLTDVNKTNGVTDIVNISHEIRFPLIRFSLYWKTFLLFFFETKQFH